MKHLKKIILFVVLAALMLLLVNPNWIPFLDESTKLAVASQLQDTFGGLFGGVGMLTPARLITKSQSRQNASSSSGVLSRSYAKTRRSAMA